jgi:ABC-type transporter Mla subunit MlaD
MNTAFNASATRLTLSLRIAAAAVLLAVLALWAATGAHRGWTRTSKVVMQHDEITGIDFPVREKTFVAGVEVLAVGVAAAGAFAAASLVAQRRRQRAVRA